MGSDEEIYMLSERRDSQSSYGLPPLPAGRSALASNTETNTSSEQGKRCPPEWPKETSVPKFKSYKGYGHLHNEVTKGKTNVGEKGTTSYRSTFYLPSRKSARSRSYSENITMGLNVNNFKQSSELYEQLNEEVNKVLIKNDNQCGQKDTNDLRKLPKTINSGPNVNAQNSRLRRSLSDNDVIQQAGSCSTSNHRYKPRAGVKTFQRPPLTPALSPKSGDDQRFRGGNVFPTGRSRNDMNDHILGKLKDRVKSAEKPKNVEQEQGRSTSMWRLKEGPWDIEKKIDDGHQKKQGSLLQDSNDVDTNYTRIHAWLDTCEKARRDVDGESVITLVSTVPDY